MGFEHDNLKLQEAYHYYNIHRYDKSKELLFEILGEHPEDGEILYLIANCMFQLDDYKSSLDFCNQAIAASYDPALGHSLSGKIHVETGSYVDAEKSFLEALRVEPNDAGTIAAYGYLMLKTNHEKKAKMLFDEALSIQPDDSEVLHYCYLYYLANNKQAELESTLEKYFETSDNDVNKFIKVGLARYYVGDLKAARELLRQAFVMDPQNIRLLDLLKAVEREGHIAFIPHRLIDKIGGPKVMWLAMIISMLVLRYFKAYGILSVLLVFYIALAAYTWIVIGVFKIIDKRERRYEKN